MERPPFKRKGDDLQDGSRKTLKSGDAAGKKMSFGAKMMAKMGYTGGGLGKDSSGIIEPVEVTVRPSKAGLGAVKEKTAQHKREEKRAAERRGEVYMDSSEEEREAKQRRRKIQKGLNGSGTTSATSTPGRFKQKYIADLEADGLRVPSTLKGLLDMTGEKKKITDSSALTLRVVSTESEQERIASRARRDLEAYSEAWFSLSEESKLLAFQEEQMKRELLALEDEIDGARCTFEAAQTLPTLVTLDDVLTKFKTISLEHQDETLLIAAVHPLFRDAISNWVPLENPPHTLVIAQLTKLDAILKAIKARHANELNKPRKRTTTPYESLILTLILPKLREAILSWDPEMPSSMLSLVQTIEPLLPRFVLNKILNELVAKLTRAVHDFNPRLSLKKKSKNLPHLWIIPMLQLLPAHLTSGLLSVLKGKLRTMLDIWDVTRGPLPGLNLWREVIDVDSMLLTSVVPRLSEILRSNFEVDPTNQNLDPLLQVLSFNSVIKPTVMGQLLLAEFFPKYLSVLRQWLEGEPNYDEVGQFYQWWKGQIPEELNRLRAIEEQWENGLHMINLAIDGEKFSEEVEQPAVEVPRLADTSSKEPPRREEVEQATFKDIVEDWCGEENLLLIPLREAHPTTGLPLFRITANAIGRGGVVVYMRGDVLYAIEKKDKSKWKPVGLGNELIGLAEGK